VQVENLFPSRMASYSQDSVGTVKIKNISEEGVDNLVVSAQLVGFMDAPLDQKHGVLEAGGEADVPVKVILDKAKLIGLDENRPAMLTLKLSYNVGEFRVEQDSSHSVMVYDRNSISWSQPRSVAAFVTPKAEGVTRFAALALDDKVAKELRQNALYYPVLLHNLIGKSGIKYLKDAVNPYGKEALDYVQYPEESLALGTGDCDDLAVLYSTLLESVGNRAALVLTPGHVLMAADTNIPVQHFQRVTPDRNKVIFAEGTVWIPVETTLIGSSFADAWKRAAEVIKAARKKEGDLIVVPVRQAWKDFAPTNLAGGKTDRKYTCPADLLTTSETQVAALDKARTEQVAKMLADLDAQLAKGRKAGLLNTKGVILAREGRFSEARKLFDESQKAGGGPEAWNNLGNIEVAQNKLDEGLECYTNALKASPEHIQVHLNAGIALFMKGSFDDALDHFVQCIELGAEEQVAMLGMLGVGPGGGAARGAEGGGATAGRDLAELALKAFNKTKKKAPKAITDPEERKASEAGGEEKQLSNYLFWL
jgi:tetratricopeptide (TPR) repeat protein